MSRILPVKFSMSYKISFSTNIRGHIYKSVWKPEKDEKLNCHKNDRDEASIYGNHAIGALLISWSCTYRMFDFSG